EEGIRSIALQNVGIAANGAPVLGLIVTMLVGVFISLKLFRWEKEEKISGRSKLWILAVLAPFIILGTVEARSNNSINREKQLERETARNRSILFNHVRIFVGDGNVIQNGSVLIKSGKIVQVFQTAPAETKSFNADVWEES